MFTIILGLRNIGVKRSGSELLPTCAIQPHKLIEPPFYSIIKYTIWLINFDSV